jgi:hypothetical protein
MSTSKNTGFMLKDGDTTIYNAMRVSNIAYVGTKQKWEATEGQYVLEQEFEQGSPKDYCCIDGVICIDEPAYIAEHKASLVRNLADYRWSITRDSVDGLSPVSYCGGVPIYDTDDARLRLDLSANAAIRKTYTDTETFRFKGEGC